MSGPVAIPKLDELLQNVEVAIKTAPATEAPIILGILEQLKAVVWSRMLTEPRPEQQRETTGKTALRTAKQVAERLNVKTGFVYELARQKKLKSVKLGEKKVMFTEGAVDDFLAQGGA